MADIKKLFDNLSELWAVGLGVVGGIIAAWKFGRSYGLRFIRALRLSDAVFAYFGPGAAKQLVEEVRNRAREGIIRESRLQLVETQLDLAIYVCSGDGKCEWVNNEVAELLGIDRVECLGLGWLNGIEASERIQVYDTWMHAVKNHLPYECQYTVHSRRTGQRSRFVTVAYPHITSQGVLLCYVGYLRPELPSI